MIANLISSIAEEQTLKPPFGDGYLFEAKRFNNNWQYARLDFNLFTSLSVLFSLELYKKELSAYETEIVKLKENVLKLLPAYQKNVEHQSFNFYPKGKNFHFAPGNVLKYIQKLKLPDDIDDSALAYYCFGKDAGDWTTFKNEALKRISADGIYDTWLGTNMPKEYDLCTLCNFLLTVHNQEKGFKSEIDLRNVSFVIDKIIAKEYLNRPFWTARHYGNTAMIIHHFARLAYHTRDPIFTKAALKVLKDIPEILENTPSKGQRTLIHSSGLMLALYTNTHFEVHISAAFEKSFYSFIGSPFAALSVPLSTVMAASPLYWLKYKCTAHEYALHIENLILLSHYEAR